MAFQKWPDADPDDELDYTLDWSDQMTLDTDTIASYAPFVNPIEGDASPLEIVEDLGKTPSFDGTTTLVWLRGGTVGNQYEVVNRIVTTEGRKYDRTRTVKVKEH